MEKKLFKLAVATLTAISVLPTGAQAVDLQESTGTLLAAGCSSCGAKRSVSYNYNNGQATDAYNYNTSPTSPTNQGMMNRSSSAYDTNADYNTNRSYNTSSSNYGTDTYNTNRGYTSSSPSYNASYSTDTTTDFSVSGTMTEADLLRQLNAQGRAIYLSLDREGRQTAIQLASQDSYRDKNEAVREAQRRSSNTSGSTNRNTTSGYSSGRSNSNPSGSYSTGR